MREVVFLLEEPSARRLLEELLPRILPADVHLRFIVFQGKQDLEKGMARKLRAWQTPNSKFVVLRDQDTDNCKNVKALLQQKCVEGGKTDALVRVACRELEAWILGDLTAFALEFDVPRAAKLKNKGKFANPDHLTKPVDELRKLYPLYQKVDGARRMGKVLDRERNQSASFRNFCDGVSRLVTSGAGAS